MRLVRSLNLRDALSDDGFADDEVGLTLGGLGLVEGGENFIEIMTVDHLHMPAVGGITGTDILALAHVEHGVEGDVVGIKENDQVVESEVAGQRGGLGGNTLLQTAVTAKGYDVIVEDGVLRGVETGGSHLLRHGVSDGIGNSLTKGAGGRLDPRSLVELGMAGGNAVELAELLYLIER